MDAQLGLLLNVVPDTETVLSLNVVVAFEDLETGARAKSTLDRVKEQLGLEVEMSLKLWKFDWLREPGVRQQAARDASEAALIIVSSHGKGEWPAPVKEWMAMWQERQTDEPRGLVVLLDGEAGHEGAGHPMLTYLQDMARHARLELFFRFFEPPPVALNSVFQQVWDRTERSSAILDGILEQPVSAACGQMSL